METYKVPPQDLRAESSVLGSCMLERNACDYACRVLTTEDFMGPTHKDIFSIIKSMYDANEPIDFLTVNAKFDNVQMLSDICTSVVTSTHIKAHCNIILSKSIRRKYIKASQKILDMAYEGEFETMTDFRNEVMAEIDIPVRKDKKRMTHIKDILEQVMYKLETNNSDVSMMKTGYKWLDTNLGGMKNNYTLLGARPSIGKSTLAINIMLNLALKRHKVAMFNLEMSKEDIVEKMLSIVSVVQNEKIRNSWLLNDDDWKMIGTNMNKLFTSNIHIYDDVFDIEDIRYECRDLANKGELDCVFIDYLQLCNTKKKTNSTNERVSHISRHFKLMQKEFNVPFWVLSQLSRDSSKEKNRRPILTDLRDSGSIEQDADTVIFLHDDTYNNYDEGGEDVTDLTVIISKQRLGRRDIHSKLKYYKSTQKIYSWRD